MGGFGCRRWDSTSGRVGRSILLATDWEMIKVLGNDMSWSSSCTAVIAYAFATS